MHELYYIAQNDEGAYVVKQVASPDGFIEEKLTDPLPYPNAYAVLEDCLSSQEKQSLSVRVSTHVEVGR